MLYESGDETGQVQVKSSPAPKTEAPVELGPPSVKNSAPAVVFHPLAYRGVVAEWPVELRERWGHRANALEESGLSWRDAEAQAFSIGEPGSLSLLAGLGVLAAATHCLRNRRNRAVD